MAKRTIYSKEFEGGVIEYDGDKFLFRYEEGGLFVPDEDIIAILREAGFEIVKRGQFRPEEFPKIPLAGPAQLNLAGPPPPDGRNPAEVNRIAILTASLQAVKDTLATHMSHFYRERQRVNAELDKLKGRLRDATNK